MTKKNFKSEFGDFQTPNSLADKMMHILIEKQFSPEIIIEPTCGLGSILLSATKFFNFKKALGIELQNRYFNELQKKICGNNLISLKNSNIFNSYDTISSFIGNSERILFVGNPPWATNTNLSSMQSKNLPQKFNIDNIRGIEAITGKSNFDICESIIESLIMHFSSHKSVFAFLCKIIVARNILKRLWKNGTQYKKAEIYPINAKKEFSANVDACFFILDFSEKTMNNLCDMYDSIYSCKLNHISGFSNNKIVNDISKDAVSKFSGICNYTWRNGIKHDCSKVMELEIRKEGMFNKLGEKVCIEENMLFPLCKSSDLAKDTFSIHKKVLITQKFINEDTQKISKLYPKTWNYLLQHKDYFSKRKSIIYKNKPLFSIFSVGEYTFKPYKIAISGFYKKVNFQFLDLFDGKPIIVDDTCNFISFDNKHEALFIFNLLNSKYVSEYLESIVLWNSKRPITTNILNSIDLSKIAKKLGVEEKYKNLNHPFSESCELQPLLFEIA